MAQGQRQLAKTVQNPPLDVNKLFELMSNSEQAKTEHLPNTGVPLNWEQLLSSIFIVSPKYGTRTTNIITLDNEGKVTVHDRSYNEQGLCIEKQMFEFIPV